eukprot:scaffold10288_cov154-Isochrysis_galbana.AAC.5
MRLPWGCGGGREACASTACDVASRLWPLRTVLIVPRQFARYVYARVAVVPSVDLPLHTW